MKGKDNFRDHKKSSFKEMEEFSRTSSALLVPEKFLELFNILCKQRNRTKLLSYLLSKYKPFLVLGEFKKSNKLKALYQKGGQKLKRISFKPNNSDWMDLGSIANGLGWSRTYLFSYFLELEDRGLGDFLEYPPVKNAVAYFSQYSTYTIWISQPKIQQFQRINYYRRE